MCSHFTPCLFIQSPSGSLHVCLAKRDVAQGPPGEIARAVIAELDHSRPSASGPGRALALCKEHSQVSSFPHVLNLLLECDPTTNSYLRFLWPRGPCAPCAA